MFTASQCSKLQYKGLNTWSLWEQLSIIIVKSLISHFRRTAERVIVHVHKTRKQRKKCRKNICKISNKSIYTKKKVKNLKTDGTLIFSAVFPLIRRRPSLRRWYRGSGRRRTESSTDRLGADPLLAVTYSPPVLLLNTKNTQSEALWCTQKLKIIKEINR